VLEGSIRKSGDQVRITARLIDAIKGHHLWSERYDRNINDIFAVQEEITMKIITALRVKLTEGEQAHLLTFSPAAFLFPMRHALCAMLSHQLLRLSS
jgi:adenylate cyclase